MSVFFYDLRFGIKFMEGLACITGFLCWARLKPSFWKTFPVYLLIITCCEITGWHLTKHGLKGGKNMYQFFVVPLEFLFFYFLHYRNATGLYKKLVAVLSLFYILIFAIEIVLPKSTGWVWMSLSYTSGNIFLVLFGLIYFLNLYKTQSLINYRRLPFYWVNIGVLLFYAGTLPYYTLFASLYKTQTNIMIILAWASVILNYIMYSSFIVSFLCHKQK